MLLWGWLLLEREITMRILGAISSQTYVSPTVNPPNNPPGTIMGINDGQNPYLIKVKLNIGPYSVAYDISP